MKILRLPDFSSFRILPILIFALAACAGLRAERALAQYSGYSSPYDEGYSPRLQRRAPPPDDYDIDAPPPSRSTYGNDVYDPDADPDLMPPGYSRIPSTSKRRYPDDHWYYGRQPKRSARENGEGDDDADRAEKAQGDKPEASPAEERSNTNKMKPAQEAVTRRSLAENPPPVPEKRGGRETLSLASKTIQSGVPPVTIAQTPTAAPRRDPAIPAPAAAATAEDKRRGTDATVRSVSADGNDTLTAEQKSNAAAKSGLTVAAYDADEAAGASSPGTAEAAPGSPLTAVVAPPADVLTKMIGQMLFVGFEGLEPTDPGAQKLTAQIAAGHIGGVVFMAHNIRSPDQAKRLTGAFRTQRAEHALLIAIDQEGGDVQRLPAAKGFQQYPSAADLGAANDPLKANEVYTRLATELRQIGFNLNFGPVADLNRNSASAIIAGKRRSYGNDPRHVMAFAKAFAVAHRDAGVLTALKHFPGHGATAGDTHDGPVDVSGVWSEDEIEPYRALADNKYVDMVMVGHISHLKFSGPNGAPASLSREAVQTLLRGSLGYEGVTITDDLEMSAVSTRYTMEETLLLAIEAGNDLLLITNKKSYDPDMPERAIQIIRKAVEAGSIPPERIRTSYERILQLKRGLLRIQKNAHAQNGAAKAAH